MSAHAQLDHARTYCKEYGGHAMEQPAADVEAGIPEHKAERFECRRCKRTIEYIDGVIWGEGLYEDCNEGDSARNFARHIQATKDGEALRKRWDHDYRQSYASALQAAVSGGTSILLHGGPADGRIYTVTPEVVRAGLLHVQTETFDAPRFEAEAAELPATIPTTRITYRRIKMACGRHQKIWTEWWCEQPPRPRCEDCVRETLDERIRTEVREQIRERMQ